MSTTVFTAMIFTFLHQVNADAELTGTDVRVALRLSHYFQEDDQGGRAFPSCRTIGRDIGLSEKTVIRSIKRLHARGHIRVIWGKPGRGHPNQYWMLEKTIKTCTATQVNVKTCTATQVLNGENLHLGTIKPASRDAKPASEDDKTCTAMQETHVLPIDTHPYPRARGGMVEEVGGEVDYLVRKLHDYIRDVCPDTYRARSGLDALRLEVLDLMRHGMSLDDAALKIARRSKSNQARFEGRQRYQPKYII